MDNNSMIHKYTHMKTTKVVTLKNRPAGLPQPADFAITEETVPAPGNGQLLLQSRYVSVDPYLRGKMSGTKQPRFELDKPLNSKIIAEVIASAHPGFRKGEFVSHYLDWKEYQLSDGSGLIKVDAQTAPLTTYLGVLGITGLSAYLSLLDIGLPKAGETLVVSGAAGAVGSIAGQIGKLMGCRVVGIVGTAQKASLIRGEFGFDEAVNYRQPDFKEALQQACPNGIDIYFDNVGGPVSDAVLSRINSYGRVIACGAIANYNDTETATGPSLLPLVVYKFLTIKGFLIADYAARFPEGLAQLAQWLNEGKLHYRETVLDGFERLPEALIGLFEGLNEGKMLVKW